MEISFLWASIAIAVAFGGIGVRLVLLAGRTGELPELMLGLFFLCTGPLGFLPLLAIEVWPGLRPDQVLMARAAGSTGRTLAVALLCVFTWRVFRSSERWSAALAGGILLGLLAGHAHAALATGFRSAAPLSAGWHLRMWPTASAIAWCTVEPLLFYRLARRRVALGLMSPLVAHRFLLWALWGGSCLAVLLSGIVSVWLDLGPVRGLIRTAAGITAGASVWLIFFPTAFYRRCVERSASARPT